MEIIKNMPKDVSLIMLIVELNMKMESQKQFGQLKGQGSRTLFSY